MTITLKPDLQEYPSSALQNKRSFSKVRKSIEQGVVTEWEKEDVFGGAIHVLPHAVKNYRRGRWDAKKGVFVMTVQPGDVVFMQHHFFLVLGGGSLAQIDVEAVEQICK